MTSENYNLLQFHSLHLPMNSPTSLRPKDHHQHLLGLRNSNNSLNMI